MGLVGYRLQARIGRGGTGTVYRATQLSLGRDVALKVLAPNLAADIDVRERFLQESTLAASLEHPNIVPIYDAGEVEGTCYIAMRYVPGSDLQALIGRERRLPSQVSIEILEQLADALAAAHRMGLIHRDVKPGNVLIAGGPGTGEPTHAWLGDFGLSKRVGETPVAATERPLGTVHYMAPEQIRGDQLDARADIYSLGCLLFQCLTGRVPYPRDSEVAVLYAHLEAPPPHASDLVDELPEALDDVIASALAKSRDDRPGTTLELARSAAAALAGTKTGEPGTPPRGRPSIHAAPRSDHPPERRRHVVGRLAEADQLTGTLDDAVAGNGGVVLLAGEPGIGKTTLARGLTEYAEQLGIPAIWSVGLSAEAAPPYWHWIQIVRAIAAWPDGRAMLSALGRQAGWLRMIVPELEVGRRRLERKGVHEGRFHIYDALLALLAAAADQSGLLLVLDDVHAADEASLLALSFMSRSIASRRILIVGTQRDLATAPGARTLAELTGLINPMRSITVEGLTPEAIEELIVLRRGITPSQAAVRRLHQVTAGNPLFVTELLRLLEPEQLRDVRAGASGALPLPAGIRDAILARLTPLSAAEREVLDIASVVGERFRATTVSRATSIASISLLELLDRAVQLRLLRSLSDPPDGYAFHHGLIQATLYDALPRARRAALHQAVGEALERSYDVAAGEGLAEVAHHFLEAAPLHDPARAVDYAKRAADRAMERFAYDQAVNLYSRALALGATTVELRIVLLQSLGEAQTRAGDTDGARVSLKQAAELALAQGDSQALVRATLGLGIWGLTAGFDPELVQLAERVVQWLTPRDEPGLLAQAKGFLAAALHWSDQLERRRELADEALALARAEHARLGNRESARMLAYVLGRYLLARWGPDSGRDDFAISDELVALSRELGDSELELLTRNWRISVLLELGRFAIVDREIARVEQMADELRQPRAMIFLALQHALRAAGAGRFGDAERQNAESAQIAQIVKGSVGELAGAAQLVMLRLQQGRLPELEPMLRMMVNAHPEMVGFRSALAASLLQGIG